MSNGLIRDEPIGSVHCRAVMENVVPQFVDQSELRKDFLIYSAILLSPFLSVSNPVDVPYGVSNPDAAEKGLRDWSSDACDLPERDQKGAFGHRKC
jgi:hypothetical protein